MGTIVKSETNLKSLETIVGNYKLVSEVRLNNKNQVQQLSGQITGFQFKHCTIISAAPATIALPPKKFQFKHCTIIRPY